MRKRLEDFMPQIQAMLANAVCAKCGAKSKFKLVYLREEGYMRSSFKPVCSVCGSDTIEPESINGIDLDRFDLKIILQKERTHKNN